MQCTTGWTEWDQDQCSVLLSVSSHHRGSSHPMSVLARVQRAAAETETGKDIGVLTSEDRSSTLTLDNPTLRRLKIILDQLTAYAQSSKTNKYSRYAWVLQGMMEEIFDELDQNAGRG